MKPCLGWDLAGYGDSGSGLCRAKRRGETITATVLRAPFICRPRHKIISSIHQTVEIETEMLDRFAKIGNTIIDVPIDLQLLGRIADHSFDERVQYYWQLVKRPVDHVFSALEPLGSNLGFAVARAAHIVGQITGEASGAKLGTTLFETYPAATIQLICASNEWTESKYKGGEIVCSDGKWHGQPSTSKNADTRQKQDRKNAGLATLANYLSFSADEGFGLNDDEFDAVLCAVTGCVPECTVRDQALGKIISDWLTAAHENLDGIGNVEPPMGYMVFDKLPSGLRIKIDHIDCAKPDALFAALEVVDE